ncbi:hypothetical protein GCM10009776_32600 [Microbacterium deminutum]|uniref:Bacterial Pleckstrin homology domain-containing protein n=1 Tax=Microbacterium deminutum TaxID=344164 RepID=A0ABN2RD03_9MICO
MSETAPILAWTLQKEIPTPDDVQSLLVEGEQPVASFKTFRDSATFTTKRLMVRDAQVMTGKKVEIHSLPYSSINMWSTENAGGMLDRDAEVELWTPPGHIKVKLTKGADVRRIDSLLAWALLHGHTTATMTSQRGRPDRHTKIVRS